MQIDNNYKTIYIQNFLNFIYPQDLSSIYKVQMLSLPYFFLFVNSTTTAANNVGEN